MSRQLADRDCIRRLLQLDDLLVDERALLMDDRVRIERAVLGLPSRVIVQAFSREDAVGATNSSSGVYDMDVAT